RHVHHREHGRKALVLDAAEITHRVIVIQHARRIAVNAHLLFDLASDDAVALAERTVVIDQKLRHNEKRYALDSGWRAFDAFDHQMDDVVGEIVLAGRDENL